MLRGIARLAEAGNGANPVFLVAVPPNLPFSLDPGSGDFYADDGLHLRGHEILRRVVNAPRRETSPLPRTRQIVDLTTQPQGRSENWRRYDE